MQVRKYLPYLGLTMLSALSQLALVYYYAPSPDEFKVSQTLSGVYTVSGGKGGCALLLP